MAEAWNSAVRIETEAFGAEGGLPVVLVMGARASILGRQPAFCLSLAGAGARVVHFGHRDTGLSSRPCGRHTAVGLTGDTRAAMAAQGWGRAHLVGMAPAGTLAQMIAAETSAALDGPMPMASEPPGWDGPPLPGIAPALLDHFAGFGALDRQDRAAVATFLPGIEGPCASRHAPFAEAAARDRAAAVLARSGDPAAALARAPVGPAGDRSGACSRITCPVLVVQGTDDPILAVAEGRAPAAGVPGARPVELAGRGHEPAARDLAPLAGLIAELDGAGT